MLDKLIRNATVVTHTGRYPGSVGIENGKIAVIAGPRCQLEAAEVIEADGRFLIPGAIDAHVHFQDPGLTHREDLPCGTMAAAAGGVTTAISHPLNIPPIVDPDSYRFTMQAYEGRSYIDYAIHGGGTAQNIGQIEQLWQKTGATSIKMFMCFSVADFPFVRDDAMYQILSHVAKIDGLAMIHAENNELIAMEEKRLQAEGRTDPMCHIESHPAVGELEAVRRAIYFLEATGARGVILHTCMAEALEEIHAAQARGVRVYAETCPHLLHFVDTDMKKHGPYLKFTPVMRDEKNRQKLWQLLEKGYVSTVGSDHSPYAIEEKRPGEQDIWKAPNGIPGIQTMLPVLLTGVSKGRLSLERLVQVTSFNPARIYGLDHCKGRLEVGYDADLVLLDMDVKKTYTKTDILSKAKWSPYEGTEFQGMPVLTLVRGAAVMRDGKIVGEQSYGKYIPRLK